MTYILMPALSPTMEHGALARWLVSEGDEIRVGDIIAEIETEKAMMEMEASQAGVIDRILISAGTEGVAIDTPLASLRGSQTSEPAARLPTTPAAAELAQSRTPEAMPHEPPARIDSRPDADDFRATPLARRLALQSGIELSAVKGSGRDGQITRADLQAVAGVSATPLPVTSGRTTSAATDSGRPTAAETKTLEQLGIAPGSYEVIALDGMRRTVARRLTQAARDIPHFGLTVDVEIDALLAARASLNNALQTRAIRISVNDFIIKAAAQALQQVPQLNASFTSDGIAMHASADIAVAVAIEGGLITPIVRRAESKSLAIIAGEMTDLVQRARDRRLRPQEFQGGTFSISNLGMYGIRSFNSIINEPHAAILSVGAGEQRAVVRDGAVVVATVMTMTLSCDHRVVDGVTGARFVSLLKELLSAPILLLA